MSNADVWMYTGWLNISRYKESTHSYKWKQDQTEKCWAVTEKLFSGRKKRNWGITSKPLIPTSDFLLHLTGLLQEKNHMVIFQRFEKQRLWIWTPSSWFGIEWTEEWREKEKQNICGHFCSIMQILHLNPKQIQNNFFLNRYPTRVRDQ